MQELAQVPLCRMTMKKDRKGNYYLIGTMGDARILAFNCGNNKSGEPVFNLVVSAIPGEGSTPEKTPGSGGEADGLKTWLTNAGVVSKEDDDGADD